MSFRGHRRSRTRVQQRRAVATNPGSTGGRVRRWGVAAVLVLVAAALGIIVPNMLRTESGSVGEVTHGATLTYCLE